MSGGAGRLVELGMVAESSLGLFIGEERRWMGGGSGGRPASISGGY